MNETPKPAVVLIPGMGNTPLLWRAQYDALAGDYRVILPDYRGSASVGEMADRVIAGLPEAKTAVAGFSLGGYIAFDLVRRFPQRVERLALISSSPYADREDAKKQRLRLIEKAREDYPALLEEMGRFIVHAGGPHAAAARRCLVEMGLDLGAEEFCRQQAATMRRPDSRELLPAIRMPVRILCGDRDVITPPAGNRYIAEHIPGASLDVVADAGHLLPLECPERVTSFLRGWLGESAAAP